MTTPSRVFLIVGILAGLCFLLATPPLRYPDENGHYLRAARVAAQLFRADPGPRDAVWLPHSIASDFDHFQSRVGDVAKKRPFALSEITSRLASPEREETTMQRRIPAAQMLYQSIGYLPQAIGFEIARLAGGGFVPTLWTVRLGSLLASILVTVIALELMPSWARWTGVAASLIPMAAYLRGSASPDALVIAMALLGTAAFLRGSQHSDRTWWLGAVALAAGVFLAVVKSPYISILLLGLLWLRAKNDRSRPQILAILAVIWIVCIAAAVWHSADVASYLVGVRPDTLPSQFAPADKWRLLIASPLTVGTIFLKTVLTVPGWIYSAIARFGWHDINPHPLLHALVIAWCAGMLYLDRKPIVGNIALIPGAIIFMTFAAQVASVVFTLWLVASDTAATMVYVQGRYFLPALACGLLGGAALFLRPWMKSSEVERQNDSTALPYFAAGGASLLLIASLAFVVLGEYFAIQGFHIICLHDACKPN
jgi:uncharacterized membrane protein